MLEAMACASAGGRGRGLRSAEPGTRMASQAVLVHSRGLLTASPTALVVYVQRDPTLRTSPWRKAGLAFAKTMDWDEINAVVMHVYERVTERRRRKR